ncbi:SDR family oxidoreductase [Sphingopyxis fribergensis]
MTETLLVTGAAGQLGRRVVETLLQMGAGPVIATTRDPAKLADFASRGVDVRVADFDDPDSLAAAFAGADRLLLISTDAVYQPGQRLAQHRAATAAAETAGVQHIVYTSVPAPQPSDESPVEDDHFWTEQALAASGMSWTIMRHALYQDLLLLSLPQAIASGHLATATNDKGRHLVTRDDCARADAAVLASKDRAKRIYEVTGPAVVTASEIAGIASEISGRPVKHLAVDKAELKHGMIKAGLPPSVAGMMARFDEAAALGFYGTVTNVVHELTGHAPTSVRDFLLARREELTA